MRITRSRTNSKSDGFDRVAGLSSTRRIPKTVGEAREGDGMRGQG